MTHYTFALTVSDNEPMSEQEVIDYIILRLESQGVISVSNIVRDY